MINKPYLALEGVQKINMTIFWPKNGDFDIDNYYWSAEKYFFYKFEQFGIVCT